MKSSLLVSLVSSLLAVDSLNSPSTTREFLRHSSGSSSSGSRLEAAAAAAGHAANNVVETRNVKGLQEGMRMRKLPSSDLVVSELCLGTMTFGEQVSQEDAFRQLDVATKEYGINFLDTAESYPVPSSPSTTGRTETIIGEWLKKGGKKQREEVVISTKICGFSDQITWCRKGGQGTRVTRDQVFEAVDAQLQRLGTDYIDLLSIHWPDRYVPLYGAPDYLYELERPDATPIKAQLEILNELVASGRVRNFGLSNETPYGLTTFTATADMLGLKRPCATQNAYSLLVRNEFETGMLEACSPINANVGLLAYSPLAGGALTGKYLNPKTVDPAARLRQYIGYMHRYIAPPAMEAVRKYQGVADVISMPLGALALAWVYTRPFVTSTIIGATNLQQLEDNVLALNVPISDEVAALINEVYRAHIEPTRGVFEVVDPNLDTIDPSKLPWGARDQDVDPELDVLINQRLSKF
jgi:aryl-alcohol dehydrogenase-like predicted oxidoreductase